MNQKVMESPHRNLPSADWVAVALAALGFVLGRFEYPFAALVGVAVFGPSVLRELGWLKDSDEWLRGVMHRAGFHATVVLVPFVFLNRVLPRFSRQFSDQLGQWFDSSFIWQTLVLVFLVSYLLQYWGPRRGVSRVLLGFGFVQLVEVSRGWYGLAQSGGDMSTLLYLFLIVGLFFILAWLSFLKPRVAGYILLFITVSILGLSIHISRSMTTDMVAGLVSSLFHVFLLFGVSGWALLANREGDAE